MKGILLKVVGKVKGSSGVWRDVVGVGVMWLGVVEVLSHHQDNHHYHQDNYHHHHHQECG